jgi:acylphosphatase
MLHGWPDDVNAMMDWARRGPPAARVTRMDVNEASGEYESFERHPSG